MNFTLKKEERLCGKKAIDALFSSGKSKTQFPIKVIYKLNFDKEKSPTKVMFVVPKKKHKRANKRNVLKRRMREIYRLNKHSLLNSLQDKNVHIDIMFIFLSNELFNYSSIEKSMCSLMNTLSETDFSSLEK